MMKKLLSAIVSGAVLLSACSLPTFAEELLTETGGAGQTETTETAETEETPKEPAEPTPEELKAAEIANVRARVDEGLRILEERQKECTELEANQPDLLATQERWSAYYAEKTGEVSIPFTLIAEYAEELLKDPAKQIDFSNKELYEERVESEIIALGNQKIPRNMIAPYLYEAVKNSMPEDEFERMCAEPDYYHLYFLDGAIGIVRDEDTNEIKQTLLLMPERMNLIPAAECSANLAYALEALNMGVYTDTAALAFRGITNIAWANNQRFHALMQIEMAMTEMGLWNVSDDTAVLGVDQMPDDIAAIPIGQRFNFISEQIVNLFAGDDVYVVPSKEQRDTPLFTVIQETNGNNGEQGDTISFETDVTPDGIELIRSGNDLYINDPVNERYLYIPGEFASDATNRIEHLRFKDGTVLDYQDILWRVNCFIGTEEADEYTGYPEVNRIFGKGGDDTLTGLYGTNYILGYDGNDTIKGGNPGAIFHDGEPNYLYGMDGDDSMTGGGSDDFLYGGKGDDLLVGGPQDDVFYYALGDGNETVDETTGKFTYPYGGNDYLVFGEGIEPEDVHVSFSDTEGTYAFVLHIMKTGETVTLTGNMYSGISPVFPIENILFADDTVWTRQELLELTCTLYGTDEDDKLTARVDGDAEFRKDYTANITLYGYAGNDEVLGAGGADTLYGGTGDDYLSGRNGDDTYYYFAGDGDDIIDEQKGRGVYPYGGHDVVILGEGINPDEVTVILSLDGYSFTLRFDAAGGSITMPGSQESGFSNIFPVEEIRFADGTVWEGVNALIERQVIMATDGDDVFSDTGDDDIIYCGKGNDTIRGKTGDDVFIYEYGDGYDKMTDYSIWGESDDTLQFGKDITPDEVYAEKLGDYWTLYVRDMTGSVSIYGIENIVFADGTAWKTAALADTAKSVESFCSKLTGDANGDGKLTVADIVCVHRYLFGGTILPNHRMADCSGDGIINALDLTILKRLVLAQAQE